jgi:hypothetical protein
VQIGTVSTWQSVNAAGYVSAAIRTDGSLWTWGNNHVGQLGNGTTSTQNTPVQVGTGATWQRVATGGSHMLAIRADNLLWAWGWNSSGQLAQPVSNPTPLYIPSGGTPLAAVANTSAGSWQLVPNPAQGRVQLMGLPTKLVQVNVFDAQGRLVRTATSAEIVLTGLAPGLYLLRATTESATRTLRLAVE